MLPASGIYAGRAEADGCWRPAAISLGPNPTFDDSALKVEVYLLDFQGWLYDRPLTVDLLARLRDIKRFDSVDALIAEMTADVAEVRKTVSNCCGTAACPRNDRSPS
jgi:riboflavin kinase/FMN adenylyltransferase